MNKIEIRIDLTNMTNIKDEVILGLVKGNDFNNLLLNESASISIENAIFKENEQIIDLSLMTKDVLKDEIVLMVSAELF